MGQESWTAKLISQRPAAQHPDPSASKRCHPSTAPASCMPLQAGSRTSRMGLDFIRICSAPMALQTDDDQQVRVRDELGACLAQCLRAAKLSGRRHDSPSSQPSGAACAALSTHQRRRCVNTPAMSSGAMPKDRRSLRYIVAMPALIKDMAAKLGRRRTGTEGGVWKAAAAGDSRGKCPRRCTVRRCSVEALLLISTCQRAFRPPYLCCSPLKISEPWQRARWHMCA